MHLRGAVARKNRISRDKPFAHEAGGYKCRSNGQLRRLMPHEPWFTKAARRASATEERPMAIDPAGGHPAMDYPEHLRTYSGFIKGTIVMIVFVVLVLLLLLSLVP
jgi:aa3 type cytochrome c oxidase subunit IV